MSTKSIGKVKLATDKTTGKTKLTRVHAYDASKVRKIAKSKSKRVVSPAKAVRFEDMAVSRASIEAAIAHLGEVVEEHVTWIAELRRRQRRLKKQLKRQLISLQYTDLTGRKPKTVKAKYHPTEEDRLTLLPASPEEAVRFSADNCREYERLLRMIAKSRRNTRVA